MILAEELMRASAPSPKSQLILNYRGEIFRLCLTAKQVVLWHVGKAVNNSKLL